MALSINLRSDNSSSNGIRSLWEKCGLLEPSPSMSAMAYPPHITLAVFDEIQQNDLFAAFDSSFRRLKKITVEFAALGFFETPHAIVIWAAPTDTEQIRTAHTSIHANINAEICRKNYRADFWTPHCSLATSIELTRKEEALALVKQVIEPIVVTFDVADCASFMPVQVLRETHLE